MENGQERYIIKIEQQGGESVVQVYDQIEKKIVKTNEIAEEAARKKAEAEKKAAEESLKRAKKEESLEEIRAKRMKKVREEEAAARAKRKDLGIDKEIAAYQALSKSEAEAAQATEDKQESIRAELRKTKQEAAQLLIAYREMSDAEKDSAEGRELARKIDDLTRKAGVLADAMDDVNKATRSQASDTHAFDAISEGLDTVISLYGVGQGAAAAFGASEQELMEMQTKFQAVLTASNALKTIQNNLQRQSNLMIAIGNIQLAAKTKAEALATSTTWGHVAAQKALNLVSRMNPYALLAGAAMSTVGILYALTKASTSAKDAEKKRAEEAKRQAEEQKKVNEQRTHEAETLGSKTADLLGKYKQLQIAFKNLRTEAEKKKWIDDNKSSFEALGLSVNGLNDAYSVLVSNAPRVIEALKAMAKAEATKDLYQEAYKNQLTAESNNKVSFKYRRYKQGDAISGINLGQYGANTVEMLKSIGGIDGANLSKSGAALLTRLDRDKNYRALSGARADKINELRDTTGVYEKAYEDAVLEAEKLKSDIEQFRSGKSEKPEKTGKDKEKEKEMTESINEFSRAYYEMVISKLKKDLENTPIEIDGKRNEEYDQVTKELEKAEEDFEKAFGDKAKAMIEELTKDFATDAQRRTNIKSEFAKKRDFMNANGMSENVPILDQREKEALDALDEEIAQRELTFQVWMESLTNLTIKGLENALNKAEAELKLAQALGDDGKATVARAKVAKAQEALAKKKINTSPENDSVKKWNDLYKVLIDCAKEFDEIGDVVGGVAGDIIKAAGQIATSTVTMINGIQSLAKSSIDATKATSEGAAAAMSTAEKASVILTVISAAMQVVTAIFGMLGKSSSQDAYEKAQRVYEGTVKALDWAIDKQLEYANALAGSEAVNAYDKAISMTKNLASAARTLGTQYLNAGASAFSHANGVKGYREISDTAWMNGAKALGMSTVQFQQMIGGNLTGLFRMSAEQLERLKADGATFYGSLDEETQKYWDAIIENEAKAGDILQQQITQLTTLKQGELADNWKNMLADMSTKGKDFADGFEKTLSSAIINSLVDSKYGERLEAIRKKIADGMADGTLSGGEAQVLRDEYNQIASLAMAEARKALEDAGITETIDQSFNRETAASVTQDTMDEVNGRLTAVQVDLQMMVSIGQLSQMNLANIEKYTSFIPAMAADIATMRADIANKL